MIPQNLIVDQDGTWQFIDQEWEYLHEVQVGYIVYRALVTSLGAMKNLSKHLQEMNTHLSPLILKVAESVGFSFSTQHLKQCMLFEMLFQHYVQGKVHSLLYEDLSFPTNREVRGDLSQTNLGKSNSHSFDFECSVIIPVFNKVELTQQCLFQLAKETDGVSYEVIVVNNNSTDGTNEFLGTIGGDVKIIHNNANLGFAKSCNQGAQAARGKYLVFLNNDTIPQSGWLRALVNEADSHQDVAVVGGKLLYTNDTVQHAGIIFNRKTGLPGHWANGVKSDSPLVNQRKQFKAVTAACMLIKRTAFEQVKGFDEAYVNGYEDVDLCLKIDREGQKIIYQPQCSLYHLESQTDGRQDHMEQNRDLFLSRWGNMWLEDQDIVAYEEGCAMVQATLGQEEGIRIIPMANDVERRQWESVMKVQKMLHGSTREALTQGQRKDQLHKVLREHEHWPMDSGVLDWGGYVCEILGFEDHAREFWCKLLTIGENLDARRSLTRVAIKHGQLEDAQMHLDKLKKNGSLSIEDTILQGTLFIQRQEYDKATVLFEDALAQEPKQRKICLGLGMAQLGQGNATNALDVFLAILKEYPDDEDAVHWVVRSGSEIKDWARIAVQLEHFLTRNPANCDIRFTLAGVYLQGGMRDKSRKEYETLRLLKPDYEGLDDIEQILSVSSLCHTTVPNDERIADVGLGIPASSQSLSDSSLTEKRVSVLVSDTICGAVRLVTPLLACIQRLGIEGKVFNSLENDNIKNTLSTGSEEVWLSQRTNTIDKETLRNAQAQGTRIVHDIDDLIWKVPDDNPNVSFVKARSLRIRKFLPFVDCVTVSTDPIRDFLTNWGIESTVLPNCLFPKDWIGLTPQSRVHRRPRVGWAGQVRVHQTDLGLLYHVMEILGDEVEWVFLGDAPERLRNSGMRMEIYPMADMNEYPQALANLDLDIALAPLVQNEFNEAKSDIRILQYGILGYPVIATDIYPHRHAPITRVSNDTDAWVRTIRERIHDLEATKVEGENLRQWVLDNRMIDHYLPQYQTAWFGLSASSPEITVTPSDGSEEVLQCIKKNECQFTTDCSIIIPVFNKAELTKQCLVELNKVTDGVSYQVIVVDNNSTDETQDILEGVKGDIHVIRNVENLGFAKACNQGAKVAHGKYLIFLNNDTIPQSGWLSTLVEEAESEHDIAIVGSKLLYPNGTIQHAGVAISRSLLMPYHIYSGLPSDDTFGNRRREFQAVTAACMLVKRKWFDAAGGFDESYRNGFEDADLCLNIRERGGRIVYQPKSWLYHLESQSPGRKLHNDHNAVLFIERWGSKHLADEDSIAFQDGMALLVNEQEDSSSVTYKRLIDEQESGSWSKVSRLQQLLLQHTGEAIVPNQTNSLTQEILQLFRCQDEMPKDVPVLEWIALRCYFLGLQDLAENYFRRALQEGESAKSRAMLARFELNRGNLSAARMHLMPLLEIKPNDGFVLHLYGVYLMQCEKFLEAGEAFHKAIEHDGDRKKSQLGIGMAHVGMGQTREAWDVFIEAAHENPDDVETMNWVIRMGTELMNWETLSQVLSRFLERNPTSVDMRFALAGVCVRQGNLNEAQMQCNTLKVLQPNFDGLIDLQKAISQDGQNSISLAS
ncbi:MAG: glycosyltransferase [Nitrospirales bacterium]